ncbi:unnamed protein product [Chilo suppressalis]|uniref:Uncharacterized protein n=1 Tax=Chilo suppressalis TaxID=168631 RepID=A0ABN8AUF0_CHISP|nr:unnamed protein product [Chilo suppressalis]
MLSRILFVVFVTTTFCEAASLIYASPTAVSHQSRVDIKHTPGFLSAPLIYSPTILAGANEVTNGAVITPVLAVDTVLTPVALSFFNNLPLARALKTPISIEKLQEEGEKDEMKTSGSKFESDNETPNKHVTFVVKSDENILSSDGGIGVIENNEKASSTSEPREAVTV